MSAIRTDAFVDIDLPLSYDNPITLREWFHQQKSKNGNPLFRAVEKVSSYQNQTGIQKLFMCFRENYKHANSIVTLAPALLIQDFRDAAKKWLSPDAITSADEITFDADGNTFVTKDDQMLDDLLAETFGLTEIEIPENLLPTEDDPESDKEEQSDASKSHFSFTSQITANDTTTPDKVSTITDPTSLQDQLQNLQQQLQNIEMENQHLQNLSINNTDIGSAPTVSTSHHSSSNTATEQNSGKSDGSTG